MVCNVPILIIGSLLFFNVYEASDIISAKVNAKYKVNNFIAKKNFDGNNDVYKATDRIKGTKVVIKQVDNTRSFEREEEEIHKQLANHDHVIKLIEVIKDKDFSYFVTEYASGGDLYNYIIERNKPLDETTAKKFLRQIAHTVHDMHELNIVHRDLKLENITILYSEAREPILKLIDFEHASYTYQYDRLPFGTTYYKAPKPDSNLAWDFKKADVYSMGIILYILVTHQAPDQVFNEKSIQVLDSLVLQGKISQETEDLIKNMTNRDQDLRLSAKQVKFQLGEDITPDKHFDPEAHYSKKSVKYLIEEKFDKLTFENELAYSTKTENRKK